MIITPTYTGPDRRDPKRKLRVIRPDGKEFHMSEAEIWEAFRQARRISKAEERKGQTWPES